MRLSTPPSKKLLYKTAIYGITIDKKDKVVYGNVAFPGLELPEGVENQICEKVNRNHPLTEEQRENNHQKAKKCCRVEHVFASIVGDLGISHRW